MSIYGPRSELDLVAVKRDDEALDELAGRLGAEPMAEDVLFLLAALTADVDAGLAELLETPLQMPLRSAATGEIPSLSDAARRRTARVVTAALIVGGLVSVSGVSAAVTGDPFTPYRNVISSVSGSDDQTSAPGGVSGPYVHQQMLSIGAAIDASQFGRARSGIARLHATLDQKPRGAQRAAIAQLAALEAKLARAEELESKKTDEVRRPTLPGAADGSHAVPTAPPGLVKKPPEKPKTQAPEDKAKPQGGARTSGGTTSRPRQRVTAAPAPAHGNQAARD
jgi:hypothetical protein